MTEEDEQLFRQVASDINEKAFFGKNLQKQKTPSLQNKRSGRIILSPRSSEIT